MSDRGRATHHLFWCHPNGRLAHYCSSDAHASIPTTPGLDIWGLRRRFPWLRTMQAFDRQLGRGANDLAVLARIGAPPVSNHDGVRPTGIAIRRALLHIMRLGPQRGLSLVTRLMPVLGRMLTPKYRATLTALADRFDPAVDLTLLACDPDIYLWRPATVGASTEGRAALLCFCTSSNSLNASLPIAQTALASRGLPVCYLMNRRSRLLRQGFLGRDPKASARALRSVLQALGIDRLYGLGASLGGYTALRYAEDLGLQRVLNFSGWPDKKCDDSDTGACMTKAAGNYPRDRIMSVLSRNDPSDREIIKAYDDAGFDTPRFFLESSTHGTFSAAIVEHRLDELLDWLLQPAPGSISAPQIKPRPKH